jgi:protoporphyrinogen oxidase
MIWDSSVFPHQNGGNETRLTAMVREEEKDPIQAAKACVSAHLGIQKEPLFTCLTHALEAIPQFEVGFSKKLARFQEEIKRACPRMTLLGNFLEGVSVEACIQHSYKTVETVA